MERLVLSATGNPKPLQITGSNLAGTCQAFNSTDGHYTARGIGLCPSVFFARAFFGTPAGVHDKKARPIKKLPQGT
ncbi:MULTISPECIES: hypothetical protein [Pseudomonas]|uniref:Uncharacterized protein n=1 Tax=Pseudomonas fluorescens TaxID=294 RepID=A0A0F4TGW8_PSEFL|nr:MULTISPECIES: hypothetical protein [Pseudomonas]KJZ43678.1 hypothetical protein VC35_19870 [Pseudomonas fluorescens]